MSCLMETSSQLMDSSVIFESMQQYWRSLIMSGSNVLVCFVYTHNWFVAITQVIHGQLVVLRRFPRQPSETEREQNSSELRGGPSGSAHLRFFAKHQLMLQDHWYGASALHGVPVYSPTFAGIHYACPQRDGQTELTWMGIFDTQSTASNSWSALLFAVTFDCARTSQLMEVHARRHKTFGNFFSSNVCQTRPKFSETLGTL